MTTTERSRRRVRMAALAGTLGATAAVAAAVYANPYPATPVDDRIAQLEARERAVAQQARQVSARSAREWSRYRAQLAVRQARIRAVEDHNARVRMQERTLASAVPAAAVAAPPPVAYTPAPPVASSGAS